MTDEVPDRKVVKMAICYRAKYKTKRQPPRQNLRCFELCPHPKNRGGEPIRSSRTFILGGHILDSGCDPTETSVASSGTCSQLNISALRPPSLVDTPVGNIEADRMHRDNWGEPPWESPQDTCVDVLTASSTNADRIELQPEMNITRSSTCKERRCDYCQVAMSKEASKKCGRCRQARYCSVRCQTLSWPHHKIICEPTPSWLELHGAPHILPYPPTGGTMICQPTDVCLHAEVRAAFLRLHAIEQVLNPSADLQETA